MRGGGGQEEISARLDKLIQQHLKESRVGLKVTDIEANAHVRSVNLADSENITRGIEMYGCWSNTPIIVEEVTANDGTSVLRVIDGMHRYAALKMLYDEGKVYRFNVQILQNLTEAERLVIATSVNGIAKKTAEKRFLNTLEYWNASWHRFAADHNKALGDVKYGDIK